MKLSQSHNLDCMFGRLTRIDFSCYFFSLFSIRLLWSHNSGNGFCELTRVDLGCFFFNFIF